MQTLVEYHDHYLLQFVLKWYMPYAWVWVPLIVALVLFLPLHRRSTRVFLVLAAAWHLCSIVLWDMPMRASVAAWVLGAALCFRLAVALWSRVPHGWFSTGLIRRYVRFDPRCVYMLDLARARRGLPPVRTVAERYDRLPAESRQKTRRGRLARWVVRAFEAAIRIYSPLPSHWMLPQRGILLDQPHLWAVVKGERRQAQKDFAETYAAATLSDYRGETPAQNLERDSRATMLAQRLVFLREAMAEFRAFVRPLPVGGRYAKQKWNAYRELLRAWRLRRDYDWLWREEEANGEPSPGGVEAQTESPEDVREAETDAPPLTKRTTPVESELLETQLMVAEVGPAAAEQEESPSEPPDGSAVEGHTGSEQSLDQDEEDQEEEIFETLLSPEFSEPDPGEGDQSVTERLRPPDEPRWQRERNRDVIEACRCLESLLGLDPPRSLSSAYKAARPHLDEDRTWSMAFHLLASYCKRSEWSSRDDEGLKRKMVEELGSNLSDQIDQARRGTGKIRRKRLLGARLVYVEVLVFLGDYARVRSMFSVSRDLTTFERRIMARACVGLADQILEFEELRDMLRYEALDHYFLAGYPEVWRRNTAEGLVGRVRSQQHLVDLLQDKHLVFVQEDSAGAARPGDEEES
jgi:hypothetical protein